MPPNTAVRRAPAPRARRDNTSSKPAAPCYDDLVLQWAMGATSLPAAVRHDIVSQAAENRRASLAHLQPSPEGVDELVDEMASCLQALRSSTDREMQVANELFRPTPETKLVLSKNVKLELCYRQNSESMFQLSAVWGELQRQSQLSIDLETLEEVVWQPTTSLNGSVCSYKALGMHNVVYVRLRDVLTFDASGEIQLIVRTMLFNPDDAARGRNARWTPPFGSLTQSSPLH